MVTAAGYSAKTAYALKKSGTKSRKLPFTDILTKMAFRTKERLLYFNGPLPLQELTVWYHISFLSFLPPLLT